MIFRLLTAALLLTFLACGDAPDPATVETEQTTTTLDIATDPVAQPDQIEATTEANPQIIDLEKMPPPDRNGATTAQAASQKQPAPKKETVVEKDATKVSKTTAIEQAPAPKPVLTTAPEPSPAPAAAPTKAPPVTEPEMAIPKGQTPDHAPFDALLKKYVNGDGNVDYAGLKQDESKLDTYLTTLSETAPQNNWTRNERLAYWINAYNGYTLKLILDNYPVKSIMDINGGKPWDKKWVNIGGRSYSLNNLEHDVIRPRFKEPRIHFALVCAAASCPPLANRAFTASNLNSLLESRTKGFLNSDKYNTIAADKAEVSSLFDWYGEDFGDVRDYLNKYAATPLNEGAPITFRDYDWSLNKQ